MTGKEMCEAIVRADFLRKADGTAPTAEEIWNSSPTGELVQVFEWYQHAAAFERQGAPPTIRMLSDMN